MAKSRRLERSTNSFSYSSYHTLDEAGPPGQGLDDKASEPLGISRIRQRPEKDFETIETVNVGECREEILDEGMFGGR